MHKHISLTSATPNVCLPQTQTHHNAFATEQLLPKLIFPSNVSSRKTLSDRCLSPHLKISHMLPYQITGLLCTRQMQGSRSTPRNNQLKFTVMPLNQLVNSFSWSETRTPHTPSFHPQHQPGE